MRENAIQLPISSLLHSLFFILAVQGTSVISGLAGKRDFAVDKNQKVQQEMVKLSLHKPRLKEYVAKFISEQS